MEKYSKKLVVFIFTLVFLVIGLGTYIYIEKFVLTEDKCVCDCDNKSIIKDNTKSVVYDNEKYKNLKIPYINIDSVDAEKLNDELEEFYIKTNKLTDDTNIKDFNMTYDYYSNSNILSIISAYHPDSVNFYKAVNINLKTGKIVDNDELVLVANYNKTEFYDTLIKIYDSSIDQESEKLYKEPKQPGEEETIYDKTINSIKNKSFDKYEMYLNNKGELCVIVEEYQPAGADTNRKIMNLIKKTYEEITE